MEAMTETQWPCMISFLETAGFSEAISEPPLASPCICSCVINTHPPSHDDHEKCSDTMLLTDNSIPITIFHLVKFEAFKSLQMVLTSTHAGSSLMRIWVFAEAHAQAPQGYQEFFQEYLIINFCKRNSKIWLPLHFHLTMYHLRLLESSQFDLAGRTSCMHSL